jgi:hypothetical protein
MRHRGFGWKQTFNLADVNGRVWVEGSRKSVANGAGVSSNQRLEPALQIPTRCGHLERALARRKGLEHGSFNVEGWHAKPA